MRAALYLSVTALLAFLLALMMIVDGAKKAARDHARQARAQLVAQLQLTDLALWTEARYARHPSQADWFSPFQDGPATLDRFPVGMWTAPRHPPGASRDGGPAN